VSPRAARGKIVAKRSASDALGSVTERSAPQPATEAQALFLAALERDPQAPARAIAALEVSAELAAELKSELRRLLEDYERGGIADPAEGGAEAAVERALQEIAAAAPEPVSRAIPARIGHYRIERTLSVGPHSAVLVAEQESPILRRVAVKLLFEDASDPRLAARVEAERQTLAKLEHPNIARIYDYGIDAHDRPYMVMEHVRGGGIVDYCRANALPLRARVELFLEACAAIRAAHRLGVLHCDLKPANILVQIVGDEPHAKVIDFGIARAVRTASAERASLTDLPQALGTLAAMSPEALTPGGAKLDTRSDVFGLGLVLFELATLRAPREVPSDDFAAALRVVLEEPIPSAARVAARKGAGRGEAIDADLDAIIAKATARDAGDRYDSVDALIADLERWLAGDDVAARQRALGERIRRGVMRRKFAVLLALTAVLALVPLVSGMFRASATRVRSLEAARDALALARELRDLPGTGDRRNILLTTVAEETRAGLLAAPDDIELLKLRADGIEEALVARLVRGDPKSDATRKLSRESEAIRRKIVALRPSDLVARADLSVSLAYKLSTIDDEAGFDEVEREQFGLDLALHEADPTSRLFADNLSWTYQRVADRAWERGERELALGYLDKSAELGEVALALAPESPVSRLTAAVGQQCAWWAARARGDIAEGERRVRRSLELTEELIARDPRHPRAAAFYLQAVEQFGSFVYVQDGRAAARALLEDALERVSGIDAVRSNAEFVGFPYFGVVTALVSLHDDPARARALLERARALVEQQRYVEPRADNFPLWEVRLNFLEGLLAMREGDVESFARSVERAVATARAAPGGPLKSLNVMTTVGDGVAATIREAEQQAEEAGQAAPFPTRFAEIRASMIAALEEGIAAGAAAAPESSLPLIARRAQAALRGDMAAVETLNREIRSAPGLHWGGSPRPTRWGGTEGAR
jgi:tRNA A-37 threonylcarbamoyl transferase component Bud32/tetratricopeptide (TPR) repeat protein